MLGQDDWWAVWLGLIIFFASLPAVFGIEIPGWMVQARVWEWSSFWQEPAWEKLFISPAKTGNGFGLSGIVAWLVTFLIFTTLTCLGAYFLKLDIKKFLLGYSCLFLIAWGCLIVSHEAHLRAVLTAQSHIQPALYGDNLFCITQVDVCTQQINDALQASGVKHQPTRTQAAIAVGLSPDVLPLSWSLQLGNGMSYILALLTGLLLGHYSKRTKTLFAEALQADWYLKTAIVLLGATLGMMSMSLTRHTSSMILTGAIAALVTFFLLWPAMYTLARRVFGLSRDSATVLAAGVASGGIAAIMLAATAVRSRPLLPVVMSIMIVIFATLELLGLPKFYVALSDSQPVVNGAALGLTIKTDDLDSSAAAILDAKMVTSHYRATGRKWQPGIIMAAADLTRYWLLVFIGLWAVLLAWLRARQFDDEPDSSGSKALNTWLCFPKFMLGFLLIWFFYIVIAIWFPDVIPAASKGATLLEEPVRNMMFMLAFIAVGMSTRLGQLKDIGKQFWLYTVGLLVFVPPVAYLSAYIFHNGMLPN